MMEVGFFSLHLPEVHFFLWPSEMKLHTFFTHTYDMAVLSNVQLMVRFDDEQISFGVTEMAVPVNE